MEEGFANILADELKNTIMSIRKEASVMFKNTRPFRAVEGTKEDLLASYLARKYTPQEEAMAQEAPFYDEYEGKMQGMMEEYNDTRHDL